MDKSNWSSSVQLIPKMLTLAGRSKAARATGFYIPERRIMLDCGNHSEFTPDTIFITHGHIDHTSEIAKILIDTGTVHPKIFCPNEIKDSIKNVIHSFYVLTKNTNKPKVHNKYTLTGVENGGKVPISFDKKDKKRVTMYVEIIKCFHTVPCVGYGFIEVRHKLKPEYINLTQQELEAIKKNGIDGKEIDISHDVEFPLFVFLGDTNEYVLTNPVLENYKAIIIECTFLDSEHVEHAKKDRHMHWNKLEPYIIKHPDTRFILIHFSTRYSDDYIREFFNKTGLKNVVPFVQSSNKEKKTSDVNQIIDVVLESNYNNFNKESCDNEELDDILHDTSSNTSNGTLDDTLADTTSDILSNTSSNTSSNTLNDTLGDISSDTLSDTSNSYQC